MIVLLGDAWLGKIATVLQEFFPSETITFVPEDEAAQFVQTQQPEQPMLAISQGVTGINLPPDAVVVPRISIDGLSSLEIVGNCVAGAEYLPEQVTDLERNKILALISKGEFDFRCAERLNDSLQKLSDQCDIGAKIATYIESNFQHTRLMSGMDRPDPILTTQTAKHVAAALGLDENRIDRREKWRTDQVAYRGSTRVLLPADSEALGSALPLDTGWFLSLARILELTYDKCGQRRPALHADTPEFAARRAWIMDRARSKAVSAVAELMRLQKLGDAAQINTELERLLSQFQQLNRVQQEVVRLSVLRWYSGAGRGREAVGAVLKTGLPLSGRVRQKLVGTAVSYLDASALSDLLAMLSRRTDFLDSEILKLKSAMELKRRKRPAV